MTGLQWQDNAVGGMVDWTTATTTTCQALNIGGYTDWRLPTETELNTLPDYGRSNPAMDTTFVNADMNFYWSSTSFVGDADTAWSVEFNFASRILIGFKIGSYYVRCVRGN